MTVKEKKKSNDTFKDSEADFIQDHYTKCWDHFKRISQWRRERRTNCKYSMSKWEFIAKG